MVLDVVLECVVVVVPVLPKVERRGGCIYAHTHMHIDICIYIYM